MKEIIFLSIFLIIIPVAFAQEYQELGVKVEVVADNLTIPWSIDWTPDGTIFFTERNGNLRVIQDGKLQETPILSLGVGGVEGGMLGLAIDPDFSENNFIYLYYTYNEFISTSNKLVRYQIIDGKIHEDKVLIDKIPGGPFHDGGRIQFGPDGKLYVTTGDAGDPNLSQDMDSLGGKILRINSDGTIPDDNPWKNSPIYSIGHRNPQGIDWDPYGNLVATEHGPSGWRGIAHDEINLIIPGQNYGWPDIIGDEAKDGMQNPILHSGDDTWAPSGSEFYKEDKIPQWTGKYFVATLRGSHLLMIDFDYDTKITTYEKIFEGEFGRLRDVATGPDGFLYVLTSNNDGRGIPKINDDKILRIVPINAVITNFEECVENGNPVMESYPRQCNTKDGKQFVEDIRDLCLHASKDNPIYVKITMLEFENNTNIKVEGCTVNVEDTKEIKIQVMNSNEDLVVEEFVIPELDGKFKTIFKDKIFENGTYTVIVFDNEYSTSETVVIPEFSSAILLVMIISFVLISLVMRLSPKIQI